MRDRLLMRHRLRTLVPAFVLAGAAALPAVLAAAQAPARQPAQRAGGASSARPYTPPRTPDGHVDLQGLYDLATLTPVERPAGQPFTLTEAQAKQLEQRVAARRARGRQPSAADRQAPPVGGDGSTGAAGGVGGYNGFWIDAGDRYVVIDGLRRTSIVVDPIDGRIPPTTAEARQRNAARAQPTSDAAENSGSTAAGAYDNPEQRPLGERCLLGFGQTAGPPALPDYFYNNLHRIVQTPDAVMIETEMIHDARVVRMNQPHLPPTIRKWMGDSVGHWEGDTLVVDTTNFTDKTRFRGSSENLHVVERFSRIDDRTLLYQFTVEDPHTWARPWKGEYTWPATDALMYEYACHEGNYALGDILRGARREEKEAAEKK